MCFGYLDNIMNHAKVQYHNIQKCMTDLYKFCSIYIVILSYCHIVILDTVLNQHCYILYY